jgi:hypothetical protein
MATQMRSIVDPLTKQDEAIFGYLTTLSDPWIEDPTGVPLILGTGDVRTTKARTKRLITVQCNASGFGFLTVNNDGWDRDSADALWRYAAYDGVGGSDIWYTDASYVGTTLPAYNATTATTGLLASQAPLVDQSLDYNSQMRQVAAGIRAWSDASLLNAAGDIRIVSTVEPIGTPSEGSISGPGAGTTDATLEGINPFIMAQELVPLAGWKSGEVVSTFVVPTTRTAFEMHHLPAAAQSINTFGWPQMGIIITGAAPNQTVKVEIVKIFEFEFQQSNRLNVEPEPTIGSDMGTIGSNLSHLHPYKVRRPATVHQSGIHNGAGPLAFASNLMTTRPAKLPALQHAMAKPSSSLAPIVQAGVSWLAKKAKSFLPGIASKALSFFGF